MVFPSRAWDNLWRYFGTVGPGTVGPGVGGEGLGIGGEGLGSGSVGPGEGSGSWFVSTQSEIGVLEDEHRQDHELDHSLFHDLSFPDGEAVHA